MSGRSSRQIARLPSEAKPPRRQLDASQTFGPHLKGLIDGGTGLRNPKVTDPGQGFIELGES